MWDVRRAERPRSDCPAAWVEVAGEGEADPGLPQRAPAAAGRLGAGAWGPEREGEHRARRAEGSQAAGLEGRVWGNDEGRSAEEASALAPGRYLGPPEQVGRF